MDAHVPQCAQVGRLALQGIGLGIKKALCLERLFRFRFRFISVEFSPSWSTLAGTPKAFAA
jgi:hypothetical protein